MGAPSPLAVDTVDLGDYVQFRATFCGTDLLTPMDPSTIDFILKNAIGTVATYRFGAVGASIVRTGTGAYLTDRVIDPAGGAGEWYFRWLATGGVIASSEHRISVARTFIL